MSPTQEQNTRNDKKGKRGLKRIINAFFYSLDGFRAAWRDEAAFRQIVGLCVVFVPLGVYVARDWQEGCRSYSAHALPRLRWRCSPGPESIRRRSSTPATRSSGTCTPRRCR